MRNFILSTVVILAAIQCVAQPYTSEIEDIITRVENGLREKYADEKSFSLTARMRELKVPGLSVAVVKDFKVHWAKAYGLADVESSTPLTTETMLQAASISKSLNAVGVMRLAQANKIDLNADINNYLTSWKFPYSDKGKKVITTSNLLSHTGGTTVHGFRGYTRDAKIPSVVQILNGDGNSASVRSMFDAGTKVQYSGGGTTITQLMVMDITGLPYEDYAQKEVLGPMEMEHSTFRMPEENAPSNKYATGYDKKGARVTGKAFFLHPELAAAGLWTTPTDLSKYIIKMQLAINGKQSDFLTREWATRMLTPFMENVGLGVFMRDKNGKMYFEHGGSNQGFKSIYMGSMENGRGIVVMVNSDNGGIAWEMINSIATVYGWDEFR